VVARSYCTAARLALCTVLMTAACPATSVIAQGGSPTFGKDGQAASSETVIISKMPERKEAIYGVLKRYRCEHRGGSLALLAPKCGPCPRGK
jgi:hypothetical protein